MYQLTIIFYAKGGLCSMKFEIILLVIMVVITISYLVFSIWHTFITKKQVTMSKIDFGYIIFIYFMQIFSYSILRTVVTIGIVLVWLTILCIQWEKNCSKNKRIK